ncbi:hypothetical protein AB0M47_09160 [Hamadaea sp. NPDC051192]|uniref:hypothetical protein n=1 Tax=Hamadaea sp. NPDC051192 TaxID=3154940 RepID=UPI003415C04F
MEALNAALHELRGRAGKPGTRELAGLVSAGGIKASHTRIYDVFVQPRLPDRELLIAIVGVLGERSGDLGREREQDRFRFLWADARGVGYRAGRYQAVLPTPPPEPPEFWTPDDANATLAKMVLAAATPSELEYIAMILNNGGDPRSLTAAVEPIYPRLPNRDTVAWATFDHRATPVQGGQTPRLTRQSGILCAI